ncbi:MAG: hypothetical protein WC413_00385 [Candidatus Nanoarchaeia archaeon]
MKKGILIVVILMLLILIGLFIIGFIDHSKTRTFIEYPLNLPEVTNRCNNYCIQYETYPAIELKEIFCNNKFNVDLNGNEKIDSNEKGLTCPNLNITCSVFSC